jgi:hypothetical protein
MKTFFWIVGIPLVVLFLFATGTIILIPGFIIAAIIMWIVKSVCKDFGLGIWLTLFGCIPLMFLANFISKMADPINVLKIFGVGIVVVIIIIMFIMNWNKKRVAKEFQDMYDETDRFNAKRQMHREEINQELIKAGQRPITDWNPSIK